VSAKRKISLITVHLSFFQRELAGTWEIRRGELLGPAEAGANQHSLALLASNASDLERTLRHRLRALAKAKPRLPELLATATDAEDGTARLAADGDHAPIVPPGSRSGQDGTELDAAVMPHRPGRPGGRSCRRSGGRLRPRNGFRRWVSGSSFAAALWAQSWISAARRSRSRTHRSGEQVS